jgi:hypothetical protein
VTALRAWMAARHEPVAVEMGLAAAFRRLPRTYGVARTSGRAAAEGLGLARR